MYAHWAMILTKDSNDRHPLVCNSTEVRYDYIPNKPDRCSDARVRIYPNFSLLGGKQGRTELQLQT